MPHFTLMLYFIPLLESESSIITSSHLVLPLVVVVLPELLHEAGRQVESFRGEGTESSLRVHHLPLY